MTHHLISIADLSAAEIRALIGRGLTLKKMLAEGREHKTLAGRTLAMIFEKSSTRTRVSFEVGMFQLGGHALFLSSRDIQIGRGEPIRDTARILSGYADAIGIRTFGHDRVTELAKWGTIPVVNFLSDLLHPCQVLADLMTIREHFGTDSVPVCYLGDGNNMANSWINAAGVLGFRLRLGCPAGHEPDAGVLDWARGQTSADIAVTTDPAEAVKGAKVVYTDVWESMGEEGTKTDEFAAFRPFAVTDELLAGADANAVVLHCLPAHRGEEITDAVMEGPRSLVFPQAANRLHLQKAILEWAILGEVPVYETGMTA